MKVNWKEVAKSEGYKSLKAAVLHSCRNQCFNTMGCDKKVHKCFHDYCTTFKWVIDKAKSFSLKTGLGVDKILTLWEKDRHCSFLNHYQEFRLKHLEEVLIRSLNTEKL